MTIQYLENQAILQDICTIEEVETLGEWLTNHPDGVVDLAPCAHLHTALLQLLLIRRPQGLTKPGDPFLRQWIWPLFAKDTTPDPNN